MVALRSSQPPEAEPLESGDVMSRAEFHRRYEQHPEIKKAELIEGVVYVPSPLRAEQHGDPDGDIGTWLGTYRAAHPDTRVSHNATVFLDNDNEAQPDISLRRITGTSKLTDGYIEGPPELIVEVSSSSVSYDLHAKKNAYRRNGVQEYIVWRVRDEAIDWFALEEGEYVQLAPGPGGVIESGVFPGLRLDVAAMLEGDLARVLEVQRGAVGG